MIVTPVTGPTNAESIIFYKALIIDAQDGIADAAHIEDAADKQRAVNNFNELIKGHESNISRLKLQAAQADENLIDQIKEFIDKYSGWITAFGGVFGEEFKRALVKLINAAKKFLEEIS